MKLEDQVVSLELAQEMKEHGANQHSLWYWTWSEWNGKTEWVLISRDESIRIKKIRYSAYTVAELGEMLPAVFDFDELICDKELNGDWNVAYSWDYERVCMETAKTEADARAKMWLHLKKEEKKER